MKPPSGAAVRDALRSAPALEPVRAAFRGLVSPSLPPRPAGPLSEDAAGALVATAEAFAGVPVERRHYEALFRWRAEQWPGHRVLYERFAATVNRAARRLHGRDFAGCAGPERLAIVEPVFRVRAAKSRWARLRAGLLRRDWVLFDRHIMRPIAVMFALTDAWRAAGYESWRGTPRGLERYTRPRTEPVREDVRG